MHLSFFRGGSVRWGFAFCSVIRCWWWWWCVVLHLHYCLIPSLPLTLDGDFSSTELQSIAEFNLEGIVAAAAAASLQRLSCGSVTTAHTHTTTAAARDSSRAGRHRKANSIAVMRFGQTHWARESW